MPESAVDARVDELLELVFSTDAAVQKAPKHFDEEAHHALARRTAAESVVLLKNEDAILPLKPEQTVALIGDFAQNAACNRRYRARLDALQTGSAQKS